MEIIKDPTSSNSQKSPLKKVGEFIKEARQARSLSIKELSSSLRIGEEQLIAIEEGTEELLPERVYVKAMIRRISEKLDIDTDFITKELSENKRKRGIINKTRTKKIKKKSIFSLPIIIVFSGFLGIAASGLTIYFVQNENIEILKFLKRN